MSASEAQGRRERRRQSSLAAGADEAKETVPAESATTVTGGGAMRRGPTPREQAAAKEEDFRAPPLRAPEVHLLGEVKYGAFFGPGVSCRFQIDHGKHWGILEGTADGHTQTAYGPEGAPVVWNHPFDLHYQTASMQGWPKIMIQIQRLESHGRVSVIAHGFGHMPCTPGCHEIVIPCWRATGTQEEELRGNTPPRERSTA